MQNPVVVWFLVGLVLLLAELVLPGLVIFFFGIGAWIAAICAYAFDVSVNTQLLIFLVSSVLSLALLRKSIKKRFTDLRKGKDHDLDEYVGKTAVALEDFDTDGRGKVSFKGTTWDAESKHLGIIKGQRLIIRRFESIRLFVEPTH